MTALAGLVELMLAWVSMKQMTRRPIDSVGTNVSLPKLFPLPFTHARSIHSAGDTADWRCSYGVISKGQVESHIARQVCTEDSLQWLTSRTTDVAPLPSKRHLAHSQPESNLILFVNERMRLQRSYHRDIML